MAQSKGKGTGITWTKNTLRIGLDEFSPKLDARIAVLVDRQADVGTSMMKTGAPWTDRTGNARATLKGDAKHKVAVHEIVLHGGMPYQIYLETRFGGKYAIIGPTVPRLGRATMALAQGLMAAMKR